MLTQGRLKTKPNATWSHAWPTPPPDPRHPQPARPFPPRPHTQLVSPDNGEGAGGAWGHSARPTTRPWIPRRKQDPGQPFGLVSKINNVTPMALCVCVCMPVKVDAAELWPGSRRAAEVCGGLWVLHLARASPWGLGLCCHHRPPTAFLYGKRAMETSSNHSRQTKLMRLGNWEITFFSDNK